MSKSKLCIVADARASHEDSRYASRLREHEVIENPPAAQLRVAPTEVAALHSALNQRREQPEIDVQEIKLLVERNYPSLKCNADFAEEISQYAKALDLNQKTLISEGHTEVQGFQEMTGVYSAPNS